MNVGTQSCSISAISATEIQCSLSVITDLADYGRRAIELVYLNSSRYIYEDLFLNHYRTDSLPTVEVHPKVGTIQGGTRIYLEASGGNTAWYRTDAGEPLFGPVAGALERG